jgi:hypothetical protein
MNVTGRSSTQECRGHRSTRGVAYRAARIELFTDGSTKLPPLTPQDYTPGAWSRIVSAFGS